MDNSSSPETKAVAEEFKSKASVDSSIEYIANNNTGYGRGHNLAIDKTLEKAQYKYHLVVNSDVFFEAETITLLQEYMNKHSDVGIVMPKICGTDGQRQPMCKLLPSPFHMFSRRFLPFLAKRNDYKYQLEFADYSQEFESPNLSGCFMFMRTEALKTCGAFDPRFFLYFEDVDLVRRIGERYRTMYYPGATATHHYARSSYSSFTHLKYHISAAIKYFFKWGWFDFKRRKINRQAIERLGCKNDLNN